IAPITRPASAQLLLPEIRKQRVELMGIVGPGSPGLYEAGQFAVLKEDLEYVMTSVPWPSFKNPRTLAVAEEYAKRAERETGRRRTFDTNSGYSYDALFVIADILERAATLDDPDAIVEAMRKTRFAGGLTLIFGVMRVVNFAHGDMMVWGMYLAFLLATGAGVDPYLAFVVCAAALFVLGFAVQRALVDRILAAPHEMQILLMLGVALVLENLALVAFGP